MRYTQPKIDNALSNRARFEWLFVGILILYTRITTGNVLSDNNFEVLVRNRLVETYYIDPSLKAVEIKSESLLSQKENDIPSFCIGFIFRKRSRIEM